jgi:glycerophosphoryl diester phosphodiesterase
VAAFCRAQAIWMNVELKPAAGFEAATGHATAALTRQLFAAEIAAAVVDPRTIPLFSSFSIEALMAARAVAPEIPRGYLVDAVPPDWHARLQALAAVALHVNHETLTPDLAQKIRAAGFGLFCYTVNDPVRARTLLAWGVDGFCTDRIDLIGADFSLTAT